MLRCMYVEIVTKGFEYNLYRPGLQTRLAKFLAKRLQSRGNLRLESQNCREFPPELKTQLIHQR